MKIQDHALSVLPFVRSANLPPTAPPVSEDTTQIQEFANLVQQRGVFSATTLTIALIALKADSPTVAVVLHVPIPV